MVWESLIDESALALLLPGEYQRFAAPIKEGLVVFLAGLPAEHQATILAEQATMPTDATVSQRLGLLAMRCPVLHKLGQVVARDQRLAPELRHELRKLESLPPTTPLSAIQETLAQELGPLDRLGVQLADEALAEASVAVVIPFTTGEGAIDGVFKLLKPGIEERLELELGLLSDVGVHLDDECHRHGIPELNYEEAFDQVREKLAWELRLDQEQAHLRRARAFYANEPKVLIPELLEYCTPRVTAMQRVHGCKVTDHRLKHKQTRALATIITRALISRPIFSREEQALFHSDPHAGNLYLTDDGRLAILDWSLVGELGDPERQAISQVALGALTLRSDKVLAALESLADRGETDRAALEAVVDDALKRVRQGEFPGMKWLVALLDEAAQRARLRVAGDLMLFRKSLLTLDGVVAELGADGFLNDNVLLADFLRCFGAEWPLRWARLPWSRDYGTRLSNADLAEAMLGFPWTITRGLVGKGFDVLERCLPTS